MKHIKIAAFIFICFLVSIAISPSPELFSDGFWREQYIFAYSVAFGIWLEATQ